MKQKKQKRFTAMKKKLLDTFVTVAILIVYAAIIMYYIISFLKTLKTLKPSFEIKPKKLNKTFVTTE
ncbi:MAG: hypothetical protein QXQ37_06255 [Nitrososphaerota archaeon]